jgi:hypothetical protein
MTRSANLISGLKSLPGIQDPAGAIQSGEVRGNKFENLLLFGQLFPMEGIGAI